MIAVTAFYFHSVLAIRYGIAPIIGYLLCKFEQEWWWHEALQYSEGEPIPDHSHLFQQKAGERSLSIWGQNQTLVQHTITMIYLL